MRSEFGPSPAAGNGIFGCGDRAPKVPAQTRHRMQRPKFGNWVAESPRRNALFGVVSETRGLRRLDGGVRSQIRTGLRSLKSPITGKNTGKNAKISEIRPRECQKPSIHGLRWPKMTKTITGKTISITGKLRKITGKKYSFRQIRGESRNDARSALGKLEFPHHPAPDLRQSA
jgi:hypothetical protein